MRKPLRAFVIILVAFATVTGSYAITCYTAVYGQQCVVPGQCYSQCTPQGCSQSTCLIAQDYGYETGQMNVNVSPTGNMPSRSWDGATYNECYVNSCTVYNNCTHQYEAPPYWCSCNFAVKCYTGNPIGCSQ